MPDEHGDRQLDVRLRPAGAGRYLSAAFLGLWLVGWLAGEVFALWILGGGAVALVTGAPPEPGADPLAVAPSLGVGIFLLVWVAFWTIGGIAAITQLLRTVWAADRLVVLDGRLFVRHALGPFRSQAVFDRESIHRIDVSRHRDVLTLWTREGSTELSVLGTREERARAAVQLREALVLAETPDDAPLPILPAGWEEVRTAEGERAVVTSRRRRRQQALLASLLALVLCGLGLVISRDAPADNGDVAVAVVVVAMGGLAGYGALWLARGGKEWVVGRGELRLQRRFGARVRCLFEARALEVGMSRDGDGDRWYKLEALADADDLGEPGPARARASRRAILTTIHDDAGPRQLGAWLARATELPFMDGCSDEDDGVDLTQVKAWLEDSGALGRWIARRIPSGE